MNRKVIVLAVILLCSTVTLSATTGYTNPAVPTRVEVVRGQGFMVFGAFGNPTGNATHADRFFVQIDHPQYRELYAMVLLAITTNMKVKAYIHSAQSQNWYATSDVLFNTVGPSGSIVIVNS